MAEAVGYDKTNLIARAWHETKDEADPEFDLIPNLEFRENLNFRAAKVKETGIANTNFEMKYAELIANEPKDDAPMAVVQDPAGLGANATAETTAEVKAPKAEKHKSAPAKKAIAKKGQVAPDNSGHVPSAEEVASIAKAEKDAPLHP